MFKEIIKAIKTRLGWETCPNCSRFVKPKWVKDWIYDPEEPPMFYHYECPKCGVRTNIEPSWLTEKAVRKLGFRNFGEYAEKVLQQ